MPENPLALVVEDEALLTMAMENTLIEAGFAPVSAYTLAEVEALSPQRLALALVDLRLGGELVGQRVIRFLRHNAPDIPIVVLTGYHAEAPQADLRGLGGPTIRLEKPVLEEVLLQAIRDVMSRPLVDAELVFGRRVGERA